MNGVYYDSDAQEKLEPCMSDYPVYEGNCIHTGRNLSLGYIMNRRIG